MGIDTKEKTARNTSVGADARQPIQKGSDNSIPASEAKRNREMDDLEERRLVILNAKEQIPRRMTGTRSIAFIFLP